MKKISQPIRKPNRNGIMIMTATLLCLITITGGSLALLETKDATVANAFYGAGVNIAVIENGQIYEDNMDTAANDSYVKVVSGQMIFKEIQIRNLNSEDYATTDTYVRVRLVPAFVYDQGDYQGQIVPIDMTSTVTYTFSDSTNWGYQEIDGERYYYYLSALAPGQDTDRLITGVTYTGVVPINAHFELTVLAEGLASGQVQSLTAWGFKNGTFEDIKLLNEM